MEFEKPNSIYFIKYIFKIPTGITMHLKQHQNLTCFTHIEEKQSTLLSKQYKKYTYIMFVLIKTHYIIITCLLVEVIITCFVPFCLYIKIFNVVFYSTHVQNHLVE